MIIEATIVSLYQRDLVHKIPGVYPGDYLIKAAEPGDISVTRVPVSAFYIDSGDDTPKFAVTQDPSAVSKSIVSDLLRAMIEIGPDAHPGLFAIDGWDPIPDEKQLALGNVVFDPKDIATYKEKVKKQYANEIVLQKRYQENWARKLVKKADDDWNKWRSHRAISDIHLWAAGFLGLNREYTNLEYGKVSETIQCPACAVNIQVGVAICFNCKAILDKEKAKQFGLA